MGFQFRVRRCRYHLRIHSLWVFSSSIVPTLLNLQIDRQRDGQDQQLLKLGTGRNKMCAIKLPNHKQTNHADENCSQMLKGIDLKEKRLKEGNTLIELESDAVQVLHELMSLIEFELLNVVLKSVDVLIISIEYYENFLTAF
ncbi:uncharacterized protein LOC123890682 isoform X2 [Trifolium pratense]|uniref:uncharacterized protein LOC123890682 isoform X2 n=1 Tax=Trifolium pratense TaxID=57577 RepID=UPI001E6904A2|nr:uncharacterized protein LOC123890682 isoform X2 [Trifolium pratense]